MSKEQRAELESLQAQIIMAREALAAMAPRVAQQARATLHAESCLEQVAPPLREALAANQFLEREIAREESLPNGRLGLALFIVWVVGFIGALVFTRCR